MTSVAIPFALGFFVLYGATAATAQQSSGDEAASSIGDTNGSSSKLQVDDYIHVGKAVRTAETIEIVATLVAYANDAVAADSTDQTYVHDISTFEVVEPKELRGKQFQVLHSSHSERASVWYSVNRTYSMLVDRAFVESDGFFGGSELVTIMEEKAL